jgi:hypothetical protein
MSKTFIPFYEVKNHAGDVLVVDAHHPQGFDLSHWRGAPIPEGCGADTSTEIVLKAIEKRLPELKKGYVTNNHYDIDGFLGVWSVFNPELALQHQAMLIEMAQIADFREINFDYAEWQKALKLVCWLNKEEAEKFYPPFGAPEIAEKEMEACVPKYHHFLAVFANMLSLGIEDIPETEEYGLVLAQVAQKPQTATFDFIRLHTVASRAPLHYYCSYAGSESSDTVLSQYADNRYELEYKYTTWVQTTRLHFPRIDLKPLAERLNDLEKSDYRWDAEHFTDTAPILRLKGKKLSKKERYSSPIDRPIYSSSIGPETFKSICVDYFSHYYEMIKPTTATKSWQELRQMNEKSFSEHKND